MLTRKHFPFNKRVRPGSSWTRTQTTSGFGFQRERVQLGENPLHSIIISDLMLLGKLIAIFWDDSDFIFSNLFFVFLC